MIICPFHEETEPSCSISLYKKENIEGDVFPPGTVHCFGCDYKSDLPTFISNLYNKEDGGRFGFKWLVKHFNTGEYDERKIEVNIKRNKKINKEQVYDISKFPFDYSYLKRRGIEKRLMYLYNIRYNPKNSSIILPIYNLNDDIIGYQEKFINGKGYINEGEVNYLYGLNNLQDSRELWLTEGPLDALSCVQNGKNAIAFLGSPSVKQLKQLSKLNYRILISAVDNDNGGRKAHRKIKEYFSNKIIKRVKFLGGEDPNDIIENFNYKSQKII